MIPCAQSIIFFSFFFFAISNAQNPPKPKAFIFPINKDDSTNQYYTNIQIGFNSTTFNIVVDLGGKYLWFNSLDYYLAASTHRPIICGTKLCQIANGVGCIFCYNSPPAPGCANNTCSDYSLNPFSGRQGFSGLATDTLHVYSTHGDRYNLKDYPFQFSDPVLGEGLASPTAGLVGLGRTRIALQAQLASKFKIREKFALCIPSSGNTGNLAIGDISYNTPFQVISKSLIRTPLIKNPVSTWPSEVIGNFSVEYYIGVKSIKVDSKILSLNNSLLAIDKKTGEGGTSLRTVRPYTSLHRSIYRALVNEFVKAATSKNITRVPSVAPFVACFDAKTIVSDKTGPQVPIIDLVLQKKSVYWRFYGSNSMVRISDNVTCLAFVEEQSNRAGPRTSIIVGGYQMENYLLEFDVASSGLGFSPSLLQRGTSCSQFRAS